MSFTYLQGVEAVYSEAYCWDTDPCALLKSTTITEKYCSKDNETEYCQNSQYGTMCEPLTESRGEDTLTLSAEDSPARTSVAQGKAKALLENEVGCGKKWLESFAKWDPNSSSWKTRQCLLLGGLESFSGTWPRWGMMRGGECWEQMPLAFLIDEPDCGWLPTPNASDGPKWYRASMRVCKLKHLCGGGQTQLIHEAGKRTNAEDSEVLEANPLFFEEVNGLPAAWTDLKPLATDKCQLVRP